MRYYNTKTGAVIDSPCVISGGDWVEDTPKPAEVALANMSVKQLKEIAEQEQIDLAGLTKKAEIIEAIEKALDTTEPTEATLDEEGEEE